MLSLALLDSSGFLPGLYFRFSKFASIFSEGPEEAIDLRGLWLYALLVPRRVH